MSNLKYSGRIITDALPFTSEMHDIEDIKNGKGKSTIESTHLLTVNGNRLKDFFYVDCSWLWKGSTAGPVEATHTHDFDEVIGFVGSNRENPHDLGGEIIIWLDGQKQVLNKSCLIFVPAGVPHFPVQIDRIDTPIFSVNITLADKYSRIKSESQTSAQGVAGTAPRYSIITETKAKFSVAASGGEAPPVQRDPSLRSTRLLHLEDDMAKGSFYVDFVWIWEGNGGAPAPEHVHDWVEMIAMVGSDPEHPRDLGGTMSIVLGDETHMITKSSLVCIPAGLKHCPWKFIGIKKPTLVFTAGPSGMYTGSHKKVW